MKNVRWFINRLKAMNFIEVCWRINQKRLQKSEKKVYFLGLKVTEVPLSAEVMKLSLDISKLPINWENYEWSVFEELDIFSIFPYERYKQNWNAGFQTINVWPETEYSPEIEISQRVDIGDIRTNWELNRHYQFAALAKSYYCTSNEKYLQDFISLFNDWNQHNLFLHGVEWTSMMELAIRVNSWVYSFAFLKKSGFKGKILEEIEHGIFVMVNHISKHYARYSSANNHLVVEMYALALVGIISDYAPWREKALKILTEELEKQNFSDGVNKEMSLHYQSFVMEAYGLLAIVMKKNKIEIPNLWTAYLSSMSEFLSDSIDYCGNIIEFGDNDEGRILDLCGRSDNYYEYVLNLIGYLVGIKYTNVSWNENLKWILTQEELEYTMNYEPPLISSRKEGGYTFLRSDDRKVLIGIDHADLGFGALAAHGHADALSFQMNVKGMPVFVDSGTYNYHVTPEDRNYYRSTVAHNTVMLSNKEQSEMIGPFIWGKRASVTLDGICSEKNQITLKTMCNGTAGRHTRIYEYNKNNKIVIKDIIDDIGKAFFHIDAKFQYEKRGESIVLFYDDIEIIVQHDGISVEVKEIKYSKMYNNTKSSICLIITFKEYLTTVISLKYSN